MIEMTNQQINQVVGDAFEDMALEEMLLSQGINELNTRFSTPFVASAALTWNITVSLQTCFN